MSPPELAADTPVLYVFQPIVVGGLVLGGVELEFVVHYGRQGDVGKVLHAEEPLHAETRLNGCVGIALRVAHLVVVVFHLLEQTSSFEVLGDEAAHLHAVLAYIESGFLAQCAVGVEDVDSLQIVLLAQHVVIGVVSRSHFQASCTELDVYVAVLDDRYLATYERYDDLLSLEPSVLGILGVDTHGCVAHDGLGAGGGHYGVVTFLVFVDDVVELKVER